METIKHLVFFTIAIVLLLSAVSQCVFQDNEDETDDDSTADDDTLSDDDFDNATDPYDWVYIPVGGSMCRDGTETGFAIRPAPDSKNVAIIMEAGGVCASPATCFDSPKHFDEKTFKEYAMGGITNGLFNYTRADNPVRDWHFVFIPSCNGDLFVGNQPDGSAFGLFRTQVFVGYQNVKLFVQRIRRLVDFEPERILLFGQCSGANGTMLAYPLVADAFPDTPVTLINDSGPLAFADQALSPCLQQQLRENFIIAPGIPDDCPQCTQPDGDGLEEIQTYLAEKYPQGNFGMLSTMADEAIRYSWGFGANDCANLLGGEMITPSVFRNAMFDLRDNHLLPTGRWSTFFVEGSFHTFDFTSDDVLQRAENGHRIMAWVTDLLEGKVPNSIGP